jgi:hypothetical protein
MSHKKVMYFWRLSVISRHTQFLSCTIITLSLLLILSKRVFVNKCPPVILLWDLWQEKWGNTSTLSYSSTIPRICKRGVGINESALLSSLQQQSSMEIQSVLMITVKWRFNKLAVVKATAVENVLQSNLVSHSGHNQNCSAKAANVCDSRLDPSCSRGALPYFHLQINSCLQGFLKPKIPMFRASYTRFKVSGS